MIRFENVCKAYGGRAAVDHVSLEIPAGQITVLLGPSGCGKSTSLRMINRLIEPDAGRVFLGGEDVAGIPVTTLRRGIGYVLQGAGLFPHWPVARNVATVPALLGWERARVAARVDEMLRLVGLDPAVFAAMRPAQLSGGQAQRVGVARALAADPPVLLMDEPFGALDPLTRVALQGEIRAIQARTGKTIVFVTHDLEEALTLADRMVLMRAGRVAQAGAPIDFFDAPADDFVRGFVGGADAAGRRLALVPAATRAVAGEAVGEALPAGASLRDALQAMLARKAARVPLAEGGTVGWPELLR